jgi:hypothetical protein
MADLRISELAALASADLVAGDFLAVADISASESKKITVTNFLSQAVTLIADATIPGAKIVFGAASIPGSALQNLAVGSSQIAADAVTAAKLGDESTVDLVTTLPVSGAFVGQIALDTDDSKAYIWNGSTWISFKAAGSINSVIGSSAGIINITVTTSGDQVTISTSIDNSTAASQFIAGPTGSAGAVSLRPIVGTDLPVASASAKGGVIVNGNGLAMSDDTITIGNTVTPETVAYHVVRYGPQGLITAGRTITGADLPAATASVKGVVIPGTGLAVLGDGTLNHSNAVTGGSSAKVSFDAQGHITGGLSLEAADIPEIPATKLTSGTLSASLIGANTITGNKLANSSITKFGGAGSTAGVVAFPNADFTGQYFFDSINGDLYLWDGNAWQAITITAGEIVFAGTYNATTNLVASVTTAGTAAGLTAASALPAASATNNRYYVVVSVGGTGTAPAPAVVLAAPDMLLSNGTAWQEIDVSTTVSAQTASNISFTPTGAIASNNVQTALAELDTEKLAVAGGTVTGELLIGAAGSLVLEGSTADGFETTIAVVDPTADRTITLPNVTGTVITTADSGTVTSTMILDGTIVNADINASAAIADTKLATIATALKVSNSATTATNANTASAIVARDGSGNFTAGTITAALTGAASSNVLKAGDTMTGALVVPLASAATPSLTFTSDLNTGIYSPGADQLAISTNGTGRLFVDASGLVGLGTSSPGTALEVVGIIQTQSGAFGGGGYNIKYNAGQAASRSWQILTDNSVFGDLTIQQSTTQTGSTYTPRLYISATGNVGIGTTSPGSALEINAAAATSPFIAKINTSEAARIDSSGRVGIGTSSPQEIIHANGNIRLTNGAGFTTADSLVAKVGAFAGSANQFDLAQIGFLTQTFSNNGQISFSTSNASTGNLTEALRIDSSQRVGIGTTSPGSLLHLADAGDITVGTTTGTKIGTATTQKIGLWNATPVVQPAAVANITTTATAGALPTPDGAITIANTATPTVTELLEYCVELETKLEDLLGKLRTVGIIAT